MTVPVRRTRQRAAVAEAMGRLDDFVTAQRLHDVLRTDGESVGLTTVYRTLQAMADAGELDQRVTDDGEASYRRCSPTHHHHLVCRGCGATVEVAGPDVESWADRVGREHGFTDLGHTVELTGLCANCS
jgi:Fur family ferric uptake transcriptional regulator